MSDRILSWERRCPGPPADEIVPGEIHLWRARGGATHEQPRWDCLEPDERRRAMRMMMPVRRNAFIFARAMLRLVLGAYLLVDPARLRFATAAGGKPYLPGRSLLFSLSHAGDGVLLALGRGNEIGVDLEPTGRKLDIQGLAAASLSEDERSGIDVMDESARRHAILRTWTRKEALLKAAGSGLARDPRDMSLPMTMESSRPVRVEHDHRVWTLTDVALGEAWQASLAVEGPIRAVRGYCLGW